MSEQEDFTPEEIKALKALASSDVAKALLAQAAFLVRIARGKSSSSGGESGGPVASDRELDGQWGDPSIRKDPKRWAGASYVGAKYSQCPSDYLIELASFLEWKAGKEREKPVEEQKKHRNNKKYFWEFDLQNAKLARGWARRNHGVEKPPPNQGGAYEGDGSPSPGEDEGPF